MSEYDPLSPPLTPEQAKAEYETYKRNERRERLKSEVVFVITTILFIIIVVGIICAVLK